MYQFQPEHIFILSIKGDEEVSNNSAVKIFVLDPSSTSLLSNRAFTSENLTYMILKIDTSDLPYPLISVNKQKPENVDDNEIVIEPIYALLVLGAILSPCLLLGVGYGSRSCISSCKKKIKERYIFSLLNVLLL